MGKPLISIASLMLGLAGGVFLGATFFSRAEPGPAPTQAKQFYYRLTDSTVVRHTVSLSGGDVQHTIDTIAVVPR